MSNLPTVLVALVDLFTTAAGDDASVRLGPQPVSQPGTFLLVGSTGDDEDGYFNERSISDWDSSQRHEEPTVECSIYAIDGGGDFATALALADDVYDACEKALAADRDLGGLSLFGDAHVGRMTCRFRAYSFGAGVRLVFSVAFTTNIT